MSRKREAGRSAKKTVEKSAKEMIVDSLKLPKDTMMGASILTVTGNSQVLVENYRGILEYTQECIMLQGKACRIAVSGCNLRIAYYTNEDMKIEGKISEIRYL